MRSRAPAAGRTPPGAGAGRRPWPLLPRSAGPSIAPPLALLSIGATRLDRGNLGGAEGAPTGVNRDLAQAFGALAGAGVGGLAPAGQLHQPVDGLDHEEEHHEGDGDEGDQHVQEVPVAERRAVDRELEGAEVRLAEDGRDQRGEQVGDGRLDHRGERGPDHERDGQVNDVASKQELLELGGPGAHAGGLLQRGVPPSAAHGNRNGRVGSRPCATVSPSLPSWPCWSWRSPAAAATRPTPARPARRPPLRPRPRPPCPRRPARPARRRPGPSPRAWSRPAGASPRPSFTSPTSTAAPSPWAGSGASRWW